MFAGQCSQSASESDSVFRLHVHQNVAAMGTKQVSAEYLSVGANRQTSVADWSANGLLAFGADVNIALWRPTVSLGFGLLVSRR